VAASSNSVGTRRIVSLNETSLPSRQRRDGSKNVIGDGTARRFECLRPPLLLDIQFRRLKTRYAKVVVFSSLKFYLSYDKRTPVTQLQNRHLNYTGNRLGLRIYLKSELKTNAHPVRSYSSWGKLYRCTLLQLTST
jgi:hypothetical protein